MRLRYNRLEARLGAALGGLTTDTAVTFAAALQEAGVNIPTIVAPQYLPLVIDNEVVYLTAYTAGATSGTVVRARESTAVAAHANGAVVLNIPTKADFVNVGAAKALHRERFT